MKKSLFALAMLIVLLVFSLPSAFSLSISSADKVPANINWSFSVLFDSMDFEQLQITLDGTNILTATSNGSLLGLFQENKQFVIAADFTESKLMVSMMGLAAGEHSLNVKTFKDNAETANIDKTFTVSDIVDEAFKQNTVSQLNSLKSKASSLDASIDSLKNTVSQLDSLLKSKDSTIADLQSALNKLSSTVDSLKAETVSLSLTDEATAKSLNDIKEMIASLKEDLNVQKTKLEDFTSAGFISFGKNFNSSILFILLAIIILSAVAVYGYRKLKEEGTLFSSEYFKNKGTTAKDSKEADYDSENEDFKSKRKWAFEGETSFDSAKVKDDSEKSRFHIGDLIKKN